MTLDKIEQLAKIFGVIIACFGIFKYFDTIHQGKVNRSVEYYDEFHSGELFASRVEIGKLSYSWINLPNTNGNQITETKLSEIILRDLSLIPNVIYYDHIIEHFERAMRCIENRTCNRKTLINLMHEDAKDFYIFFLPKISERREKFNDFSSDGLLCFATRFSAVDCPTQSSFLFSYIGA